MFTVYNTLNTLNTLVAPFASIITCFFIVISKIRSIYCEKRPIKITYRTPDIEDTLFSDLDDNSIWSIAHKCLVEDCDHIPMLYIKNRSEYKRFITVRYKKIGHSQLYSLNFDLGPKSDRLYSLPYYCEPEGFKYGNGPTLRNHKGKIKITKEVKNILKKEKLQIKKLKELKGVKNNG